MKAFSKLAFALPLLALACCAPESPDTGGGSGSGGPDTGGEGDTSLCEGTTAVRVMPLGDSITLGVNGGYRNGVFNTLRSGRRNIDFVGSQSDASARIADRDHEGHPGFNIGDISRELNGWMSSARPDVVLLMVGTNDIAWWSARGANEIATAHAALMDRILESRPNVWLVVGSVPPITSQTIQVVNMDRAQLARDFNAAVRRNVESRQQQGRQVRFVDVHGALTLSDLYDGVHPSEAAHAKVADRFVTALQNIVPRCN